MKADSTDTKLLKHRRCSNAEGMAWICFTLLSLVFGIYMTSRAAADTFDDAESGQLYFEDHSGRHSQAIHLASEVAFSINGMIARAELSQSFQNTSADWQEGVYVFPLPENAAVNYMEMHIAERIIVGEIKEKNIARKIYQQALQQGKRASLIEQQRPNLFTQKIANIGPGETVTVTLHYLQRVGYDSGRFSLRFPMTLTPRYIPGQLLLASNISGSEVYTSGLSKTDVAEFNQLENKLLQVSKSVAFNPLGWALATTEVPDANEISPYMRSNTQGGNTIKLSLNLNAGLALANIDALYHDIDIRKNKNSHKITLRNGVVPMDRDFVLQWSPVGGSEPQAAIFKETLDRQDYLLLMMLPPQPGKEGKNSYLARDMVFVIDTSGSMQGTSIVQAKQSLQMALSRLQPGDNFNIIEFNSTYTSLYHQPQPADSYNINEAIEWVKKLDANGGTEMSSALRSALSQFEQNGKLQQLVFITDGSVGNEGALFELIHQLLGNTRLFTVGIGSAPNSYFMRKAAEFGRGAFIHVGATSDVSSAMFNLFEKLESAVVSHINVQWPGNAETYPEKVPDLYRGEPLLLAAKMDAAQGEVLIDGFTAESSWSRSLSIDTQTNSQGVGTVWARAKVEALEDKKNRGMKAENVREKVIEVALLHRLVTAYTSFVAVEKQISRAQNDSLKQGPVPNLVASGQVPQAQTVAYPQGASSAGLSMLLGFLSIVIWLIYCLIARIN